MPNTIGNSNTAVGWEAMVSNDIGHNNTVVGRRALSANTTGDNNTAVGNNAIFHFTGSGNTAVGSIDTSGYFLFNTYTNTGQFGFNTWATGSNRYHFGNSAVTWIGGQVGWSVYSDGRYKRNVAEDVVGLDFITRLRPVSYQWDIDGLNEKMGVKSGTYSDNPTMRSAIRSQEANTYTGFVAQEVAQVADDLDTHFSGVNIPENEQTPYSLNYSAFVVPLVKAVQEQQAMIESMQEKINQLESKIRTLEKN